MKYEYKNGVEARKNFEETMQKIFRAPKATPKPKPPKKEGTSR
jgi:hypothetical protein